MNYDDWLMSDKAFNAYHGFDVVTPKNKADYKEMDCLEGKLYKLLDVIYTDECPTQSEYDELMQEVEHFINVNWQMITFEFLRLYEKVKDHEMPEK